MNKFIACFLFLSCIHFLSIGQPIKKPVWTEADRQFLLEGLKTSQAALLKELDGLNQAQITFKPDSSKWSIAEVAEHVAVYDEYLNWDLTYGVFTPERPDLAKDVKLRDQAMLDYEADPNKGQAPWLAKPLGRFNKQSDLINYFNTFRNAIIAFVSSTQADLRLHFIFREPDGSVWQVKDLHQQTLLFIAHTRRHTEQIRKVKQSANYPRNGKLWTESDRLYIVDNFKRTRDALLKETEGLSADQWNFREAADRWTIAEIVEHLGIWEKGWSREIDIDTRSVAQPELNRTSRPDSYYATFIMEEKKHDAPEFAIPSGLIDGPKGITIFLKQHELNLKFVESTQLDLRSFFEQTGGFPRNLHQVLLFQWGHIDRHLRQIRKVKSNPNYPKKR